MNRTPVADWQQLSALYELADTLDPDLLADWLEQLRLQAHPLLPQLEQMMAARAQVQHNGFLGTLPCLATSPEPRATPWQAGSRIGPYRLLRKIGSGGMAEVWLAQRDDGAFQRQVAIKLLFQNTGSSERDTFAQRFDRERDILASLNHPHIAGLHDAGVTPSGQPWLALEYVEGQMLTMWCDARSLGVDARVRLFRQVLLAVQHAHANLVIHRDLKPGNILVTAQGDVRLLDFGIAKLMEPEGGASVETELTRMAGRPMTPQYASPEQLLGQPLTTACDVYALGVVLYELLCGERPYELKVDSAAQLEQAILDMEPRAPSRRSVTAAISTARGTTGAMLHRQLGSDLDAIVLRALAKQPTRRYSSVEAMRVDLDRWLGGEPVEARAPSTVYRVGKFVRRHTLSVSLSAAAVVSLVAVAAVAVVMGLQAREDSARAVAARDFMLNIFARANQEKSRGTDITARDLLETGRKDVLTRLAGQPRLQVELLRGIAKTQSDMGEFVFADNTFAELARIYASLRQPRETSMAKTDRAFNSLGMNDPTSAAQFLREANAVNGRPVTDAELNARTAEVTGWLSLSQGNTSHARDLLSEAHATAIRTLGEDHLRTFKLGQALFRAERDSGHTEAALAFQEGLRRSAARIGGFGADELAVMDWEQVNLLNGAGQFARAFDLVELVRPKCIDALGPEAQPCRYLSVKRAQLLLRLGRLDQAKQALSGLRPIADDVTLPFLQIEALIVELRVLSVDVGRVVSTDLANAFERVRKFAQASRESKLQPSLTAGALLALAESRLRTGDDLDAMRWIDSALAALSTDARMPLRSRTAANAQTLLAIAWLGQGRFEDALRSFLRSDDYLTETLGPAHAATQLLRLNKVMALAALGRIPEALATVETAKAVLHESLGVEAPTYKRILLFQQQLELAEKSKTGLEHRGYGSSTASEGAQSALKFFGG